MKILSWNVNGLRACVSHGFIHFITTHNPDIIGLQETKLQAMQIPDEIYNLKHYHNYWNFAEKKGYSGVSLLTKIEPANVSYSIGDERFGGEGRIIQADYTNFTLLNIYYPNGQMSEERLQYKLHFYDQFLIHVETLRKKQKNIIIIGDFNTAHKEIDLAHPKANSMFSGFLPIEREWLTKFIEHGYVDSFRCFNQDPHQYSWWSFQRKARENNVGWRIDYCFVTTELLPHVKNAFILPDVLGSDHCPVGVEIDN